MATSVPTSISQTIQTYEQHGWVLRRLLLTDGSQKAWAGSITANIPIAASNIDAAWFARPPGDGPVAWEIRYLGEMQYALVEHLDENAPGFEDKLHAVESRLAAALVKRGDA